MEARFPISRVKDLAPPGLAHEWHGPARVPSKDWDSTRGENSTCRGDRDSQEKRRVVLEMDIIIKPGIRKEGNDCFFTVANSTCSWVPLMNVLKG